MVPDYLGEEFLSQVMFEFGLKLKFHRKEIPLEGSPERVHYRTVVEDVNGQMYVAENIGKDQLEHKQKIIDTLDFLDDQGLERINPYLKSTGGKHIVKVKETYWQLSRFIDNKKLPRPDFIYEKFRSKVFAQFLIDLNKASRHLTYFDKKDSFSIVDYIYMLRSQIKNNRPDVLPEVEPIIEYLEKNLFDNLDQIPLTFCHGDYHPINTLWNKSDIVAVIDWEFLGYKPEIYDIANFIGCVGIENPASFDAGIVPGFIQHIKESGIIDEKSWTYLIDYIVANRFAWLSEWLRKKDEEMLELELVYMSIIIKHKKKLEEVWFKV